MATLTKQQIKKILALYSDFKTVYGPYQRESDKRNIIVLYDGEKRTARQLARVLLEVKLGRFLTKDETVDHINEDFLDDRLSNLRVLSREENARRSVRKAVKKDANCVLCGKKFQMSREQFSKRSKNRPGPFCSPQCRGKANFSGVRKTGSRKVVYGK